MASISEQPCYTLINFPSENEATSEVKLKEDIGKERTNCIFRVMINAGQKLKI